MNACVPVMKTHEARFIWDLDPIAIRDFAVNETLNLYFRLVTTVSKSF